VLRYYLRYEDYHSCFFRVVSYLCNTTIRCSNICKLFRHPYGNPPPRRCKAVRRGDQILRAKRSPVTAEVV
jgi:hypothetical protein